MAFVSNIIDQSFSDLGVTQPGESVSSTIQAAAFLVFQQMWMGWANDETLATFFVTTIGTLLQNIDQYAFGAGGVGGFFAFNPVRVLSWKGEDISGYFSSGGQVIPLPAMRELQKNGSGRRSVIPEAVACDLGNNRGTGSANTNLFTITVFPRPAVANSSLYLDYMGRLIQFNTVNDPVALPEGYEAALHYNLAIALAPQYARLGGVPDSLAVNAANSLKFIRDRNAQILGLQQAAPPVPAAQ